MIRPFGKLGDGAAIEACVLDNGELRAEILSYGGILRSLSLAGSPGSIVLGLSDLAAYERDPAYLGCIVGRCGNRIAGARFTLDGRIVRLSANDGPNHLHGGRLGLGKRAWRIVDFQPGGALPRLRLGYRSPAGEEGYPGTVDLEAGFTLRGSCLELEFAARSDAATPLNLSYHPYFNLCGDPRVPARHQRLRIPASRFLPVDAALLPTGALADVGGTPLDFRRGREPAADTTAYAQLLTAGGYDHCLVLDADADCAAELYSPETATRLRIHSDAPGIQFYGGHGLPQLHPQLGSGLCLEPQIFPDAVNQPHFPRALLMPGETGSRRISYEFSTNAR